MIAAGGRFLRDPRDVIVALRLLVLAGLAMLGIGDSPEHPDLFWATTIAYGVSNLAYMASGATRVLSPGAQRAVFLFDVLVVSALIVMRGVHVPEFILAYFTLVLMAAMVHGIGSAALNALVVCTLFAAVSLWGSDPAALLAFPVLAQFVFFFVVSLFMSQLAEVARQQAHAQAQVARQHLEVTVEERTRDLSRSEDELEQARDRLAAADRLATIGTVAAGFAHDIRNPVAALRAALDEAPSLIDELESGPRSGTPYDARALLRSAVDDARDACDHLQHLVGDLTSLARTAPAEPVAVRCDRALESAARLLRHRVKAPMSMSVRCAADVAVIADPGRLQQVLLNHGSNAIDAMEDKGGVLTIAAEPVADGWVRFRVEDTGVGMSDEVAAKALGGFFTTKAAGKGTGLGLHLVREIAQAHGARIDLVSKLGCGTTFHIDWPAEKTSAPAGGLEHEHHDHGTPDRRRRGGHSPSSRAHAPA
jgi:signal transduction histidine kinase